MCNRLKHLWYLNTTEYHFLSKGGQTKEKGNYELVWNIK